MILTPEEAAKCWCPHGSQHNTPQRPPDHQIDWALQTCLGPRCMAWQWVDDLKPFKGYCGLSRKAP
jgi:hypothetical protein